MAPFENIDLSLFPKEREEKLKSIWRYSMFEVMFYRSNLLMHAQRVLWLTEEMLPLASQLISIDADKARTLALVHDDAEMITGDVQAGHKARMSEAELAHLDDEESRAIQELAAKYPQTIGGYSYCELLTMALKKNTIESQFVSYADKLDAHNETMHELFAGNITFLRALTLYERLLTLFPQKFPDLKPFLESKDSPLTYITDRLSPDRALVSRYTAFNKPHTQESIRIETDFPFYNEWRRIVIERGGDEGIEWLTKQREFVK